MQNTNSTFLHFYFIDLSSIPTMKLRVVISDRDIRKLDVGDRMFATVVELKTFLTEKLSLTDDFVVMYEDSDFGNDLCTLEDVTSLNQIASTVRLMFVAENIDTVANVRPNASQEKPFPTSSTSDLRTEKGEMPRPYNLPIFDLSTRLILEQKQQIYDESAAMYIPGKNEKSKLLSALCEDIYRYKCYPNDEDCTIVARALVDKFPCLKEKGGPLGFEGWKNSLKYKMGNLRNQLSRAGVTETAANGGRKTKYQTTGTPPRKAIKKARRSESNYLPNVPAGETAITLEENVNILKNECSKTHKDLRLLSSIMSKTFAHRRKEIVGQTLPPMVVDVLLRWPALFIEPQVMHFKFIFTFMNTAGLGFFCVTLI